MKIAILDSLKKRNNARSNLVCGLSYGFNKIKCDFEIVKDKGEFKLGVDSISKDVDLVIIPYWISRQIYLNNISEIKKRVPNAKIAIYSGTSIYWEGCDYVDYDPLKKTLKPMPALSNKERDSFDSIDYYFVIRERDGVKPINQYKIGMGKFFELKPEKKSKIPTICIDFMKKDWDEDVYMKSIPYISDCMKKNKNLQLYILGLNEYAHYEFQKFSNRIFTLPHHFAPWDNIIDIWKTSWAFVAMNESFGYPVVENLFCGSRVFAHENADISIFKDNVLNLEKLSNHLDFLMVMDENSRNNYFKKECDYFCLTNPDLISWENTCEEIIKIFK